MSSSTSAPLPDETGPSSELAPSAVPPEPTAPPVQHMPSMLAAQPEPSLRSRFWPDGRLARVLFVVGVLAFVAYLVHLISLRYGGMFSEFSADGDQPQAVWHYWRYNKTGAFPPGQLHTDYAFVMHAPPGWWVMMASLSTLMSPLIAAKFLNLVAYVGTHIVIWAAVARRSNAFIGLAAAFLLLRNVDFSAIIAGGYARSFGPILTLAFLGAFMAGAHRLVLVILVVQSALYPSVVIPCGFAYGVYTVVAGPMTPRLRRMAGMFAAGLLIIAFGKFQEIRAPAWWGDIVTLEEAMQMPAWQAGGRVSEAPLKPAALEIERNVERAFRRVGKVPLPSAGQALEKQNYALVFGGILLGTAAVPVLSWRARRRGQSFVDAFPWQIPALFVGALAAYFLARALAFKLYLPYRPLQHVWAYCFYAGVPLLTWCLARNLIRSTAIATLVAVVVAVVPTVLFFGDGNEAGPANYSPYASNAKLYRWVQKQPVDKIFAGEFGYTDKTPLFAWHQSYVTKNLSHPFRRGYYDECERRIRRMYEALYSDNLQAVVDFAHAEHVDYFIVRKQTFDALDSRLFQPVKNDLAPLFKKNKAKGFALASPPARAVVFTSRGTRVLSVAKLEEALREAAVAPAQLPASPAPSEGAADDDDDGAPSGPPAGDERESEL